MADAFRVVGTSRDTANVDDIVISDPENEGTALTRRIARPILVDNLNDASASVKCRLMHQRRASNNAPWQDADSFNLATLKAGQYVRLTLTAGETKRLYDTLGRLYQIEIGGWNRGEVRTYRVVDEGETLILRGRQREIVAELLDQEGDSLWESIEDLRPGLLQAVALKRQHTARQTALDEFAQHLAADDWTEIHWQPFFKRNIWIFGHNLAYQFLTPIDDQPYYGGTTLSGRDGQRGDFMLATAADARFTVLVDIKKPSCRLVSPNPYRNQVHQLGPDVTGGVAQLQSNCQTWYTEGAQQRANAEDLADQGISTFQPRGILIVGHTEQLGTRNKRSTFELFRRNLINPEVITYDELLERAHYIVATTIDGEVPSDGQSR